MAGIFDGYDAGGEYDEMFESPGVPRDHYRSVVEALASFSFEELADRQRRADLGFLNSGITFTVYSESSGTERIFPFDLVPRVIPPAEWAKIEQGLRQRVVALNHFLQDVYNEGKILSAGLIPRDLVYGCPSYQPLVRGFTPPGGTWIQISGIDLVRHIDGTYYVLEDNCRTPSGVSYVIQNRLISTRTLPRVFSQSDVQPVSDYANRLHDTIRRSCGRGTVAVLTPGPYNSAYFEHTFLAKQMGTQLVEGRDLAVHDDRLVMRTTRGLEPLGSLYRRVDDEFLDPKTFRVDSQLGVDGLFQLYRDGKVGLVNAIGTGVADDKSIYPFVPEMIRYYLGETPILENVPTYHAGDPKAREYILQNLKDLVVKPTGASGGYGVVVGPSSNENQLDDVRELIEADPSNFIAQPLIRLSTCPTVIDGAVKPRRIDLRPFVLYDGIDPWVLPGGLTRVALREGSFIVNSSQGGGSKDTWVLNGAP
ncbi:MAG: circularly permuted type 2 ATP-grasp protein [Tepidiformaceae bacterium]